MCQLRRLCGELLPREKRGGAPPCHRDGWGSDYAAALLSAGAEKDLQDRDGRTPPHWAAHNGNADCVELLGDRRREGLVIQLWLHAAPLGRTQRLSRLRGLASQGRCQEGDSGTHPHARQVMLCCASCSPSTLPVMWEATHHQQPLHTVHRRRARPGQVRFRAALQNIGLVVAGNAMGVALILVAVRYLQVWMLHL